MVEQLQFSIEGGRGPDSLEPLAQNAPRSRRRVRHQWSWPLAGRQRLLDIRTPLQGLTRGLENPRTLIQRMYRNFQTYDKLLLILNKFISVTRAYLFAIGIVFMTSTIVGVTISTCYTTYKPGARVYYHVPNWAILCSFPVILVLTSVIIDQMVGLFLDAITSKVPFAVLRGRMMACYVTMWQNNLRPTQFSWWLIDFVFVWLCDGIPLVVSIFNAVGKYYDYEWWGLLISMGSMVFVSLVCDFVIAIKSMRYKVSIQDGMETSSYSIMVHPSVFKKCMEKEQIMVASMGNLGWFNLLVALRTVSFLWGWAWCALVLGSILLLLSALAFRHEWKHKLLKPWVATGVVTDTHLKCIEWEQQLWGQATYIFNGEMGICDDDGFVREVCRDGQAHSSGIEQGVQIVKVDSAPYSKDTLASARNSGRSYRVTFQVREDGGEIQWKYMPFVPDYGRWHKLSAFVTLCWLCLGLSIAIIRSQIGEIRQGYVMVLSVLGALVVLVYGGHYYASLRPISKSTHFLGLPFCTTLTLCLLVVFVFSVGKVLHWNGIDKVVTSSDVTQLMNTTEREDFQVQHAAIDPVCQLGFGDEFALSAIDLSVLSWYVYAVDNTNMSNLSERTDQHDTVMHYIHETFGKDYPANKHSFNVSELNTTPCGKENMLRVDLSNTTVIAVRGTANLEDLTLDAMVFATSALLQAADDVLVPVTGLLPKDVVGWLLLLSTPNVLRESFEQTKRCVQNIKNENHESGRRVVITGHSLGGLIAEIVGVQLGLETIVFSAPGFERIRRALNMTYYRTRSKYTVIVPDKDPVPMVDGHPGVVHTIACHAEDSQNLLFMNAKLNPACHSLVRTVCHLEKICGNRINHSSYMACQKVHD